MQKDKIENLEKELELKIILFNIKVIEIRSTMRSTMSDKLEIIQEIIFVDGETKVVVNAKYFLDTIKL